MESCLRALATDTVHGGTPGRAGEHDGPGILAEDMGLGTASRHADGQHGPGKMVNDGHLGDVKAIGTTIRLLVVLAMTCHLGKLVEMESELGRDVAHATQQSEIERYISGPRVEVGTRHERPEPNGWWFKTWKRRSLALSQVRSTKSHGGKTACALACDA